MHIPFNSAGGHNAHNNNNSGGNHSNFSTPRQSFSGPSPHMHQGMNITMSTGMNGPPTPSRLGFPQIPPPGMRTSSPAIGQQGNHPTQGQLPVPGHGTGNAMSMPRSPTSPRAFPSSMGGLAPPGLSLPPGPNGGEGDNRPNIRRSLSGQGGLGLGGGGGGSAFSGPMAGGLGLSTRSSFSGGLSGGLRRSSLSPSPGPGQGQGQGQGQTGRAGNGAGARPGLGGGMSNQGVSVGGKA